MQVGQGASDAEVVDCKAAEGLGVTASHRVCICVCVPATGACIGAGVDMVSAADLRYCTADATFCVKVGLCGCDTVSEQLELVRLALPGGLA
jgi:enoyl-CoA hydratase